MADVTDLLLRWSNGDRDAFDELVPVVYRELKRLAHVRLRHERTGLTLNTTGLVHEAYLRLVDVQRVPFQDRQHFLALAARAMARVLIDQARRRGADKRVGGVRLTLEDADLVVGDSPGLPLDRLEELLHRLEATCPRSHTALCLVYFGGFTQEEAAAQLDVAQPTVSRDLRFAKAWMAKELGDDGAPIAVGG